MSFDIIIKNGNIIDGTGSPYYRGDVGIHKGRIEKIGFLKNEQTDEIIDAADLVVCPGFIDMHSHSDASVYFDNTLPSTIHQGITTSLLGNCGENLAPLAPETRQAYLKQYSVFAPPGLSFEAVPWNTFDEYLGFMEKHACVANAAHLVGFATVRVAGGPGYEDRRPTAGEVQRMRSFIAQAMQAGAFGMSSGLIYAPQSYAGTDEIISLAQAVGEYNGLYCSHIRGEGATVVDAVQEAIEITQKSGCRGGHIAHHKVAGKAYWGKSRETLQLIEDANARGLSITCDQYPYNRGMTSLITLLPPWVHAGGLVALVARLKDPACCARIIDDINRGIPGWENWIKDAGFEAIYIASVKTEKWRAMEGRSIREIAQLRGGADDWETLFKLLVDENGEVSMTLELMDEEDIRRIMTGRYTMIGTDAWGVNPAGVTGHGKPHPRYYGTYPRILGKYVREEGVLTLEDAVRRMTSFPAQRLGLMDRGVLKPGMWADIVVFDPGRVNDKATYQEPHQFPEGIPHVLVNGRIVVKEERQTGALPGRVLRYSEP
ncbi:MAG: D-aminoacylase [Desulfobacterales bacterium]